MFWEIYKAILAAYLTIQLAKLIIVAVMGVVARNVGVIK